MNKIEFNETFQKAIDTALEKMAETPDINAKTFYGMVYFLENLSFFAPVFYGLLNENNKGGKNKFERKA